MRIELTRDGGFAYVPGLARPIVLHGAELAADDLAEAIRLCRAAIAARSTTTAPSSPAMPDARRYRLAIEIDGERHQLNATDPVQAPAIAKLVEFVQEKGADRA